MRSAFKSSDSIDRRYIQPKKKIVTFSQFDEVSEIESTRKSARTNRYKSWMSNLCSREKIIDSFTIISLVKGYRIEDILPDLIAGLTVSVMHIPQGMAYMAIIDLPVITGLYMGLFPTVIYFLFGSSRHISIGSFAVISIMVGSIIENLPKETTIAYTRLQIASAIAMVIGIWDLAMFVCRFGFFCSILSKTMVSALTCGAAVHVLVTQVPEFLGINIQTHTYHGVFNIVYKCVSIGKKLLEVNFPTLILSGVSSIIIIVNKLLIKPKITDRYKYGISSIPIELIVMIVGTLVSYFVNISEKFGITIVGEVPTEFPMPIVPKLTLIEDVFFVSLVLMLASYGIAMSCALSLALNSNYVVDPHQELLALGLCNIFSSFFSCIPVGVSLTRSVVQKESGGHTQAASMVSCLVILITILFAGPILEPLPCCILSSIIIVSLRGMLSQVADFPGIWKVSSVDGTLWLVTFVSVVVLDIGFGVGIGVLFALISIYYHSMTPYMCLLGKINIASGTKDTHDEMYIDMIHSQASEIPGKRIIQILSTLHFANKSYVMKKIQELAGVFPGEILKLKRNLKKQKGDQAKVDEQIEMMMNVNFRVTPGNQSTGRSETYLKTKQKLTHIIVDLSLVSDLDPSALRTFDLLIKLYEQINVTFIIVSYNPILGGKIETVHSVRAALRDTV